MLSGVGVIVGAGIYVLVGATAGKAGGALWLSFLLAAVVAAFTGASYARFATLRPKDSPEFQYTSMAFGLRAGFTSGWLMLWADLIAVAAVALGFGGYFDHFASFPPVLAAIILVVVLSGLALWGIVESVALVVALTAIEVGGLVLVTSIGLPDWGGVDYLETPRGFTGVWAGAALAFFAYLGFDELGNLAEETRQPERTLPRALFAAMAISTALYLTVAVSVVSVLGWEELSRSDAPLALMAGRVLGGKADVFLTFLALAATANTVLLLLISGSRALYGMASGGVLPQALGRVGRRRTPWIASLVVLGVTVVFILVGSLEQVAKMTDAVVLAPFTLVNLALVWVMWRRPGRKIARRVLTDIAPPALGAVLCVLMFFYTGLPAMLLTLGLLLAGVALAVLTQRGNGARAALPPR